MTLGFIESKADSNLCFKVEGGRPVMLPVMCRCTTFQAWRCGQGKYAVEILNRFRMMDCKAMTTSMVSNLKLLSVASTESIDATMYRQMIYLTNMRPDICFAMNTLRHVHLMVAKHAVRYLKGTVEYGLKYDMNLKINLECYVDLDWVGNAIHKNSTSGCYFSMRS